MKTMKLLLVLSLILALSLLCGCDSDKPDDVPTDTAADTHTAFSTERSTEAPTEAPTAAPTEAPTEKPAEAPTEAPTEAVTEAPVTVEKTAFADFSGKSGKPSIDGDDGWNFGSTAYTSEFKDGKLILGGLNSELIICRLALTEEQRTACAADTLDNADAVGFRIENNSNEAIGVCWFGEIIRPDLAGEHQQMYTMTPFDEIECWLLSEDGKLTKGSEYYHDDYTYADHGLCEVPAHFKGWYICSLPTLGHDQCAYGAWGGHNVYDCGNGTYIKGSSIANIGFSLLNSNPPSDASYVIGEYVLVSFK